MPSETHNAKSMADSSEGQPFSLSIPTMSANEPSSAASRYLRVTVIGLEFSSPIIAGLVAGYYLGEYLQRPWIGLVGLLAGVFLGFYRLIWEVRQFTKGAQ